MSESETVQGVLEFELTDEVVETFCVDECAECGQPLVPQSTHQSIFVWGEPFGGAVVLHAYCSQTCVRRAVTTYGAKIERDVLLEWRTAR